MPSAPPEHPRLRKGSRMQLAAALATVYIAWGATYPAIKVLGRTVPPFTAMGARFLTAGLLLFVLLGLHAASCLRSSLREAGTAAVAGVWILGDIG